jgi:hypothetical protein
MAAIKEITFDGFSALELRSGAAKLILVTECGPRVAYFGNDDSNFLYWDKNGASSGEWRLYGGHRVWITRIYADESVDAYIPDNMPCSVSTEGETVTVTSPPSPVFNITRGMKISALSDGKFSVTNFIINAGPMIYSGGVWSPTCVQPEGKRIIVPIGEDTTWDIVKIVIPRKFAGNTVLINDPQVTFTEEEMIVLPAGVVSKRCLKAPKGEIRCEWPGKHLIFTKHSAYIPNGRYPLDGCNIAVFVGKDNWMAEMETFGIEQPVIPGQMIENNEIWSLTELP